eukprot:6171916-Pleurochrysis_carterae.AAC.7
MRSARSGIAARMIVADVLRAEASQKTFDEGAPGDRCDWLRRCRRTALLRGSLDALWPPWLLDTEPYN